MQPVDIPIMASYVFLITEHGVQAGNGLDEPMSQPVYLLKAEPITTGWKHEGMQVISDKKLKAWTSNDPKGLRNQLHEAGRVFFENHANQAICAANSTFQSNYTFDTTLDITDSTWNINRAAHGVENARKPRRRDAVPSDGPLQASAKATSPVAQPAPSSPQRLRAKRDRVDDDAVDESNKRAKSVSSEPASSIEAPAALFETDPSPTTSFAPQQASNPTVQQKKAGKSGVSVPGTTFNLRSSEICCMIDQLTYEYYRCW
jgi:hypothetical protein